MPLTDFFGSVRPVQITTNMISSIFVNNATYKTDETDNELKTEPKSKEQFSYVPQMPDFDSIIKSKNM